MIAFIRHLMTRKTPVAAGQIWIQDGDELVIDRMIPGTDRFVIRAGNASWGESQADWQRRLDGRRPFLLRNAQSEEVTR